MFYNIKQLTASDPMLASYYGGKAANLALMHSLGFRVPAACVYDVYCCTQYYSSQDSAKEILLEQIRSQQLPKSIAVLEQETLRKFGAKTKVNKPLLLSVRSGAPVSMPGMMDTILNVGLNDRTVKVLAAHTNLEFAWDCYRRLIQSYGIAVLGIEAQKFERYVNAARHFYPTGVPTVPISQHLVDQFKILCEGRFPQDVDEQLFNSMVAVWESWKSERAIAYRKKENIPEHMGTAVILQEMVFGNLNDKSGTGVLFTRNPTNGDTEFFGDFLLNAQGEEVVSGTATTRPIADLRNFMPEVYDELSRNAYALEARLRDMCDIEFTIEDGQLYMLQVRVGKRAPKAANRIALHLLNEGLIDVETAENRLQLVADVTQNVNTEGYYLVGHGQVAHDGDVEGIIALTKEEAITLHEEGKTPILFTVATDPADMPGIAVSAGIVTLTGGLVSHAAVVARAWNLPCIVSLVGVEFFSNTIYFTSGDREITFKSGDHISIKASEKGAIYLKKAE